MQSKDKMKVLLDLLVESAVDFFYDLSAPKEKKPFVDPKTGQVDLKYDVKLTEKDFPTPPNDMDESVSTEDMVENGEPVNSMHEKIRSVIREEDGEEFDAEVYVRAFEIMKTMGEFERTNVTDAIAKMDKRLESMSNALRDIKKHLEMGKPYVEPLEGPKMSTSITENN